jgi:hypothetical protein
MSETLSVIFDGEVFRPENPVNLPPNTRYEATLRRSDNDFDEGISPELTQEMEALTLLSESLS